jgi:hypothetical protein
METLSEFSASSQRRDIHALARYVERHLSADWEAAFEDTKAEMLGRYEEIGDSVYAIYGTRLFRPVQDQFKAAGLRAAPRLPFGNFSSSREWGPEDDRQRWFWSKITADSESLGTIVVVFYHDHEQIRIPRPPGIHTLEVTSRGAVVRALSQLSPEFGEALDMKAEIAQYMASLL